MPCGGTRPDLANKDAKQRQGSSVSLLEDLALTVWGGQGRGENWRSAGRHSQCLTRHYGCVGSGENKVEKLDCM